MHYHLSLLAYYIFFNFSKVLWFLIVLGYALFCLFAMWDIRELGALVYNSRGRNSVEMELEAHCDANVSHTLRYQF
ncbi:hypothetical protein SLEP1_g45087 [Rubroshorea leprosula]|uniref:Uncharacterized protein n=1 Tax=Rubroshorea leprosula TaxID=152421 RepID=A0AAV5LK06_9ROSI|nr:hypothetical protein SLEP1_g45087 [Rubroshorea leprosula]